MSRAKKFGVDHAPDLLREPKEQRATLIVSHRTAYAGHGEKYSVCMIESKGVDRKGNKYVG